MKFCVTQKIGILLIKNFLVVGVIWHKNYAHYTIQYRWPYNLVKLCQSSPDRF
jgi:hypothetical protein